MRDDQRAALATMRQRFPLGRDALAGIVEVHHAHRDLRSVVVLGG
ncbi:hypothetical protein [Dactylosporangium sp. CA-139066]